MDCSLTEARKPPAALAKFFDDPPLLPSESREEYERLFSAIVDAAEPADAIAWLFTRDIADLSWEIRRERAVKAQVIASARNAVVEEKLTPIDKSMLAHHAPPGTSLATLRGDRTDLEKWQKDPTSRPVIEKKLADKGHDEPSILAEAYVRAAASIDAIDRRIASYELRRMAALREAAAYSARLAGQLKASSEAVIEGEFIEVAQ